MISENARMATAKEARYRIREPNSMPRSVKLIALDDESAPVVRHLAGAKRGRMAFVLPSFLTSGEESPAADTVPSLKAWMGDLSGRTKSLIDSLDPSDLVMMVSRSGAGSDLAVSLGEACAHRGVAVTVVVLAPVGGCGATFPATLDRLRRHAAMLVVASDADYLEEMLAALRV